MAAIANNNNNDDDIDTRAGHWAVTIDPDEEIVEDDWQEEEREGLRNLLGGIWEMEWMEGEEEYERWRRENPPAEEEEDWEAEATEWEKYLLRRAAERAEEAERRRVDEENRRRELHYMYVWIARTGLPWRARA